MSLQEDIKQESSMSVQSRVSILDLANLAKYYEGSDTYIKTMSQLVAWSLDALVGALERNGLLKEKIETVHEANQYLETRGLYQRGLKERNRRKLSTALTFENLRQEGIDPKSHVPVQYSMMHKGERSRSRGTTANPVLAKALDKYDELYGEEDEQVEMKPQEEVKREWLAKQKGSGIKEGASGEELDEYDKEREKEVQEKENAELDNEELKGMAVSEE